MKKISRFLRSHLGPAIAATTVAVVLVGGVITLTLIGTGGSAPGAASAAPTTSTTLAPPAAAAGAKHRQGVKGQGVKGQVSAINGAHWTVTTAKGAAVTIDVGPSTSFGTQAVPLTASAFKVGDQVVVVGTRTKTTVSATRIAEAPSAVGPAPTTTAPPAVP